MRSCVEFNESHILDTCVWRMEKVVFATPEKNFKNCVTPLRDLKGEQAVL